MKKILLTLTLAILSAGISLTAQTLNRFFAEIFGGVQMSELRKVDKNNTGVAPYLHIAAGYQLDPAFALGIGYQGPQFKYSGDNINHKYTLIDAKAIINLNELVNLAPESLFLINAELGGGAFINSQTDKTNAAFTFAITPEYRVMELLGIKLRVGGVTGKDIYESNSDLLMNVSLGVTKYF